MISDDQAGRTGDGAPERPGAEEPTEALLDAARRGDVAAWHRLDERYRRVLVAMMRGRVPSALRRRFDTEDILQSAFLAAFQELDTYEYRGKGSFLRWLASIFRHRLSELIRKGRAQRRDFGMEIDVHSWGESGEAEHASSLREPADIAAAADELARTVDRMRRLDDVEFLIVARHRFEQRTIEEISVELDVPVSRVRRRLAEAIGKLKPSPAGEHRDAERV